LEGFNLAMAFVEILWILKSQSLGQSEDQVKMFS
jgi:hypothetical protein